MEGKGGERGGKGRGKEMEGSKTELEAKLQMRGGGGIENGFKCIKHLLCSRHLLKFSLHPHDTP